ncbi:MAG: hypothetical protein ACI9T8_000067 [Candidatus Saccharimonadales bacterium]|jgi:hypothetical protein
MSEKQLQSAENLSKKNSQENLADKSSSIHEKELSKSEKEHGSKEHVQELIKSAENNAASAKEFSNTETENTAHPVLVNRQLKNIAFSRALTRARKKLSIPSRVFSKVIHNEALDRSSEFVGKTVARPVSMLSGAVFAFIGTSALLWLTRKYGYEYNYLVVVLLFGGGWLLGIVGELALRKLKTK